MDKGSLELLLSQGLSVAEIAGRYGRAPSTVSCWMEKFGLEPVQRKTHPRNGGEREPLELLVEAGMTIAEIAAELGLSGVTVRRRLARFGLRTSATRRIAKERAARDAGITTVTLSCDRHGAAEFVLEGRGYYRCKRCRAERVARRRRKIKAVLVAEAGGCCCICGYDHHIGALQFHHVDPQQKRYEISQDGVTISLDAARAEAKKCVLLCSNCHAEVEGGAATLPDTVSRERVMLNTP